jgi:hypothetical protein
LGTSSLLEDVSDDGFGLLAVDKALFSCFPSQLPDVTLAEVQRLGNVLDGHFVRLAPHVLCNLSNAVFPVHVGNATVSADRDKPKIEEPKDSDER